jgi:hypothetical protein
MHGLQVVDRRTFLADLGRRHRRGLWAVRVGEPREFDGRERVRCVERRLERRAALERRPRLRGA